MLIFFLWRQNPGDQVRLVRAPRLNMKEVPAQSHNDMEGVAPGLGPAKVLVG